jgi:two-component system cell cycle sensor histidine kinase/response regulator CckA
MIGYSKTVTGTLIITLVTVTTLVMALFGVINYYREYDRHMENLQTELKVISGQLSQGLAQLLWDCNFTGIEKIMESTMENRNVYALVVKEPKKTITRSRDKGWHIVSVDGNIPAEGLLSEKRDILFVDERIGELWVYVSPRYMKEVLRKSVFGFAIGVFVLNFCLVSILFLVHLRTILKPLKAIENYAARMSRSGGLEDENISDEGFLLELSNLKHSIEEMVGQIKSRYNELERSQRALQEAEAKYRGIFENAVEGIFQTTPDGRFLSANPAHARMYGYESPDDLIAGVERIAEQLYVNPEDRRRLAETLERDGVVDGFEAEVYKRDKSRIWMSLKSRAVRDATGQILYYEGTAEDITKRKHAEEELKKHREHLEELVEERTARLKMANEQLHQEILDRKLAEEAVRESEDNLKTILYSIQMGVLVVDEETHVIVDLNEKAASMIGDSREKIVGSICHRYVCPAEEGKCPVTDLRKIVDSSERVLLTSSGEEVAIIKTVVPAVLGGRNRLIESFIDITERKQIEEERLKTHKLESIGILAGGIAHDFNNLLGIILGNVSLAKMSAGSEGKLANLLENAEKAIIRASDLTKQFITFSTGGEPLRKAVVIGELLSGATRFSLSGSSIKYDCRIADDLWVAEVDEGQLRQVIYNMLLNAREAMPRGGFLTVSAENVMVDLHEEASLKEGRYVRITIEDHGVGIQEENLAKVFDPYFTTKELGDRKGMGLGLTICYSIIKHHGGTITVESRAGVGTRFRIYLPAIQENFDLEESIEIKSLPYKGKILVMDDEEMIRTVVGGMLENLGYEVGFARDGTEAIELWGRARESHQSYDAVIMDLTIPGGMGGQETIQKLLEIDPRIKGIASSGYSYDPVMSEFSRYGFAGAIAKPYRIEDIGRVISKVLERSKENTG